MAVVMQPFFSPPGGGQVLLAHAADASFNSDAISMGHVVHASFVFTWTGFNTTDAVAQLQVSNDGTNWDDKTDALFTFATASGVQGISLNGVVTEVYYRVAFTHGTNSAGTLSCIMAGKE